MTKFFKPGNIMVRRATLSKAEIRTSFGHYGPGDQFLEMCVSLSNFLKPRHL